MTAKSPIDWAGLAHSLGTIADDGSEHGSSIKAREALEQIVGPDEFISAVDHYVACRPGFELVRHVLWYVRPGSAMQRCYTIYRTADDPEERIAAIDLLRVVADGRALPWISEFLADAETGIQVWGAGVLDQLLFSDLIDVEDCGDLLSQLEVHSNEQVRSTHAFIQEYLAARRNRG